MNIGSKIAILCITQNGKKLACKIKSAMDNGDIYFIENKKDLIIEEDISICVINSRLKDFVAKIFDKYEYIVFIMATGIVIRTIADLVSSKFSDPAILVCDEKGKNLISLLSGHMGGANEMTLHISKLINCNPVITTATDVNEKSSLDMIAKKLNGHIEDFRDNVKEINSMLVNDKSVGLYIDGNYELDTRGFIVLDNSKTLDEIYEEDSINKIDKIVVITHKKEFIKDKENTKFIKLVPKNIVIGVGCRRNIDSQHLKESLIDFLSENNIDINSIKEIGSIEVKKDEKAIIDLSTYLNIPFKTIPVEEISKVDCLFDKSEWVKKSVGVYCVSEPVAYLLSDGNLIIQKQKYKGITFSVGRVKI